MKSWPMYPDPWDKEHKTYGPRRVTKNDVREQMYKNKDKQDERYRGQEELAGEGSLLVMSNK